MVEVFNAILANDLQSGGNSSGTPGCRALPIAGDEHAAEQLIATLMDASGFDPVDVGPLAKGWCFERDQPGYCVLLKRHAMVAMLAATKRDELLADYSWHAPRS